VHELELFEIHLRTAPRKDVTDPSLNAPTKRPG